MALQWGDIQRLKFETGYNVTNVGAEIYVLNGYAAVFDAAIAPYLFDQGSSSSTPVTAQPVPAIGAPVPVPVVLTLASNPNVTGQPIGSVPGQGSIYGVCFQVGTKIVVDVGPNQEAGVIVQAVSGLQITASLALAHGTGGTTYPVLVQGGEYQVRDILARLDNINAQMRDLAPITAGVQQADEVKLYPSERGRRGNRNKIDDLNVQRDLARKDLAATLGIPNLWEMRGKFGGAGGGMQEYEPY